MVLIWLLEAESFKILGYQRFCVACKAPSRSTGRFCNGIPVLKRDIVLLILEDRVMTRIEF